MPAERFGERVLRARLEMGARRDPPKSVTQKEIGAALGVTGVAVGTWEAGQKEPDLDTVYRLATALGVRAAWLAFGEEPMLDQPPVTGLPKEPEPGEDAPEETPQLRPRVVGEVRGDRATDAKQAGECAKGAGMTARPGKAQYMILVAGDTVATLRVTSRLTWYNMYGAMIGECASSGFLERQLEQVIRERAQNR